MEEPVMYLVVRSDLKMPPGKIAAQAGHAVQLVIRAVERWGSAAAREQLAAWEAGSYVKIALRIDSEEALLALSERLTAAGILHARVVDEGRTSIPAGSLTAIGVQPRPRAEVAPYVGHLRLL